MTNEQTMLFKRLIEHAHKLGMQGKGQEAQDIRLALADARRYWFLRDQSAPDDCRIFLATNEARATNFKDPAWLDRQVDTDNANREARERATKS